MKAAIVGFGYVVPKGFYHITNQELAVFEGSEMIFVTFAQKHGFMGDFDGQSMTISNDLAPNQEEIDIIKHELESNDLPGLHIFTVTIGGDQNIVDQNIVDPEPHVYDPSPPVVYDPPVYDPDPPVYDPSPHVVYDPPVYDPQIEDDRLLRQQQEEEYQLALALDISKQDIRVDPNDLVDPIDPIDPIDLARPDTNILQSLMFVQDESPVEQFKAIANRIINRMTLVIGDIHRYRIVEVEFYYKQTGVHDDVFVHGDAMQKNFGTWYFHRQGNTYKGLDIVFGTTDYYGGILIRSIQSCNTGELVSGSSCCVDKILSLTEYDNIFDLTHSFNLWVDNLDGPLRLEQDIDRLDHDQKIYCSQRVGLSLKKHPNPSRDTIIYLVAPYRFMIKTYPNVIPKGRPNLIIQMIANRKSLMEIIDISGSRRSSVIKLMKEYENGRKLETIQGYGGNAIKQEDLATICGWYNQNNK